MGVILDAFAERKTTQVMEETWGHLAPEPRRVYKGHVLFALGTYGDIVVLECEFAGMSDSPWFYEHLQDWTREQVTKRGRESGIWRFDGTYIRFKNGKAAFRGKVRPMRCVYRFAGRAARAKAGVSTHKAPSS